MAQTYRPRPDGSVPEELSEEFRALSLLGHLLFSGSMAGLFGWLAKKKQFEPFEQFKSTGADGTNRAPQRLAFR